MNSNPIAGRFMLEGELGAGGMGVVYRGIDTQTQQTVAIKHLKLQLVRPDLIERFRREGQALRDLNHPNIVKMLAMIEEDGQYFLIMDYVSGGNLQDYIQQRKLSIDQIIHLSLDLADALTRAHRLNIIHRDLKPANILITADDTLRLTDFGVAHMAKQDRVTGSDAILGTVDYLAPELFQQGDVNPRTDIWSFGIILVELLTGKNPFHGDTMAQLMYQIMSREVPDLEVLNPDAPVALVDLIYRMLAKNPDERISSVRLVGAELEAIMQGSHVNTSRLGASGASPHSQIPVEPVSLVIQPLVEPLTEREADVLRLLGQGLSNRQIAQELFIEISTVKWYNRQIYGKLGVNDRAEAVIRAKAIGLLESPEIIPQAPKHNLPVQTTEYIGRDRDLNEISSLIEKNDGRLVTILAPGGMGKSRLAIEVAMDQVGNCKNGVYFVELAALSDETAIPSAISEAIGYQFLAASNPQDQLLNYLANKQMLLVLDNFEHLMDGMKLVSKILTTAPDIRVLATSREALNLSGETVYTLGGMAFPDGDKLEDVLQYDAVKLFIQSATRVRPNFEISPQDLPHIASICRLTGGLPLGILLSAAWIRVLKVSEIADELTHSADILESEIRDIPQRQRSIRAIYEHSWNRLTPQEQECFMKLSVFRGGFTRQAAQTVSGAGLRQLMTLTNHSLIQRDNYSGRYEIHELLRQYAEEQLEHSHQAEDVRNTHSTYNANWLHERVDELFNNLYRAHQQVIAEAIDRDFENVRSAWRWSITQKNASFFDCALKPLRRYCGLRFRVAEALELFESAVLALQTDDEHQVVYGKLLAELAGILILFYQYSEAENAASKALDIALSLQDQEQEALCLFQLSRAAEYMQHRDEAWQLIDKSIAIYRELNYKSGLLDVLAFKCNLAAADGFQEMYRELLDEVYEISLELGDALRTSMTLLMRTRFEEDPDFAEMEHNTREMLQVSRELGNKGIVAALLGNLGVIVARQGNVQQGREYAEAQLDIMDDLNITPRIPFISMQIAPFDLYLGNYDEAQHRIQEAYAQIKADNHTTQTLSMVGWYHCINKDYDKALNFFIHSLQELRFAYPAWYAGTALDFGYILPHTGGSAIRAVELVACALNSPWTWPNTESTPLWLEWFDHVKTMFPEDTFKAAWERGKSFDLESVIKELRKEFGDHEVG